ncbi:Putative diguanylate cyclase (GGDEF domain) with GAF sensor domain [marine actinobacterium PHSC20C1]|nr:Putative diguanylate cyclase (GGDEF domain) with GAF sensor domain [marine actinobacterium PHSC20C1]
MAAGERRVRDVPRPSDHPSGHARGPNSQRLLLVGSGPAVGWGVTSHELGLPGALARALSALTGFGYTIDVIADPNMNAADALSVLESVPPDRYDAVIVTVGVNDALTLTPLTEWTTRLRELMAGFTAHFSPTSTLFVVGVQPIQSIPAFSSRVSGAAEVHARSLNQVTLDLTSRALRIVYLPLGAPSEQVGLHDNDRYRTAREYVSWASQLACQMVPHLIGRPQDARAHGTQSWGDEEKRQRDVELIAHVALNQDLGVSLGRITALANRAFRTETALITVLGADVQWSLAQSGRETSDLPREMSLCNLTIQHGDVLIVPDTLADRRFRDSPLVTAGPRIRFYAGFPIEAPSGERIGALCVVDSQPRCGASGINEPFIRELALMAQREIWQHVRDYEASSSALIT